MNLTVYPYIGTHKTGLNETHVYVISYDKF